ncbi:phosphatidylinositol N-acetylglucosaminyltransferase [Ascoidea rubescens DSM 1968]|uniref:Gpi1-domain-containing protein n=1 Tax=Ascoidea rubescens DSM 1968 TaxID=1344418 RepID=A0A1D2VCA7_9ASCO|nr:Gpi1-domain-containing protein [Ascoidea rubescens DSM 1968]ODV59192.1 Gpi1-domain-containing protein [Ascoidea rubescens DSM 1968]
MTVSNLINLNSFQSLLHSSLVNLLFLMKNSLMKLTLWLMDNPGGLKLNENLSKFFGELILWIIEFYSIFILNFFAIFNDFIIKNFIINFIFIRLSYFLGLSLIISILIDLNKFINFNILIIYNSLFKILKILVSILKSLIRLFYGKKYNIFRKRIDFENFEIDQLILGTFIFIILIFLLPTILIFFSSFLILKIILIDFVSLNFEILLIDLNFFPIFLIMLKIKDNNRIPNGIKFKMGERKNYLKLLNESLKLNDIIFNSYYYLSIKNSIKNSFNLEFFKEIFIYNTYNNYNPKNKENSDSQLVDRLKKNDGNEICIKSILLFRKELFNCYCSN